MNVPFDPNSASARDSGIFGLPYTEKNSQLVLLPVPWEATTSYGGGTSQGPSAIVRASRQVDLFDWEVLRPYEPGIFILQESEAVHSWNSKAKNFAQKIINHKENSCGPEELNSSLIEVNKLSEKLNDYVFSECSRVLNLGKWVGIVGGDHSVPYGGLLAIAQKYPSFGILHFDAHSDTRCAYEGFKWSHASIFYNILENIPGVSKVVQVGIRDFCEEEHSYCQSQGTRVSLFLDSALKRQTYEGISWQKISQEVVGKLPEKVWISFDIDGLDPALCPHTGTPVPGGLDFTQTNYLLSNLVRSGRKIIGFDLSEVAPGRETDWDANVGARMLYKLSAYLFASQGLVELR